MNKQVRAIFGDFQTPPQLANEIVAFVTTGRSDFSNVIEPTCGDGSFLLAAIRHLGPDVEYFGFDINPDYVETCRANTQNVGVEAHVDCRDFYQVDWKSLFDGLPGDILVLGNPPWVTNAALGSMGGTNLPEKTNFQGHTGFEAKTGKANFDISEWMLISLLESLQSRNATLAMICKTATARKVLRYAWRNGLRLGQSSIHLVDAAHFFGVSVDACLLLVHTGIPAQSHQATIYSGFGFSTPIQTIGMVNGDLVSDVEAFQELRDLDGIEYRKWRSGVKHDASKVMELEKVLDGYRNGLGETWLLEPNFLYPLLKSSDLANGRLVPQRYVLITQEQISDRTDSIAATAPKTWGYLVSHASMLDARSSSIYANRARFAVFGVGPYTFSPWKVAISGLYKTMCFRPIGCVDNKPIVVDDTCYFFPCETEEEAQFFASMLNSATAIRYLHSLVFFDSKRSVTIDALKRIDLKRLAERLGLQERAAHFLKKAPYEQGAQQLMVFERQIPYHP